MNSEEKPTAAPAGEEPSSGSIFHAALLRRARQQGLSVSDALARERAAALSTGVTEECLLPDEVDSLLASPGLSYRDGTLIAKEGHALSGAETDALQHLQTCAFCQSLVRIAQPQAQDLQDFLASVRAERQAQSKDHHSGSGHGSAGLQPAYNVTRKTAYWPMAVPLVLLTGAAIMALTLPSSVFTESYLQSWQNLAAVGPLGAALGLLLIRARDRVKPDSRHALSSSMGSTGPILGMSIGAFLAIVLLAGKQFYQTDQEVQMAQTAAVQSLLGKWSPAAAAVDANAPLLSVQAASSGFDLSSAAFKPCSKAYSTLGQIRYCSALEGGPGGVVLEYSPSEKKADIYWEVRGKKIRNIELAVAQIRRQADGSKRVAMASAVSPVLDDTADGDYKDGESVIAISQSASVRRMAHSLPKLDETSGRFALMRTSLSPKK